MTGAPWLWMCALSGRMERSLSEMVAPGVKASADGA